jgi:hypothetical protein
LPSFASGISTVAVSRTNGKYIGNMDGDCSSLVKKPSRIIF